MLSPDEMPYELRQALWTDVYRSLAWGLMVGKMIPVDYVAGSLISEAQLRQQGRVDRKDHAEGVMLIGRFWVEVIRKPISQLENATSEALEHWWFNVADSIGVYDAVDFMVALQPEPSASGMGGIRGFYRMHERFNRILEQEGSPWRFVDYELVPISSPAEIEEVAAAKANAPDLVRRHLGRALDALADRPVADVHHAITESIQAVECMAKHVLGVEHGTLGKLVQSLEARGTHPAFAHAFSKFYGYTSDEGGLRHAFKPGQDPTKHIAEGRFFVVTASAFVNYLSEVHGLAKPK